MEWDELKPLLDRLEDTATPREVIRIITKAKNNPRLSLGDFIRMIDLKDAGIAPKLNVVPPKKRIPMGPLLEEGWEWGHKGAFDHRDDPQKMIDFCSPYSSKRNKFLDEMTEGQGNMADMIYEDVSKAKAKANRKQAAGPDNIEDALNEVVRKKLREKGEDTTE
jgi:hypothetical protein